MTNCGVTPNSVVQLWTGVIPTLKSRASASSSRNIMETMMLTDLDIKRHQPGKAEDGMKDDA
jgi:hypothetical protein